MLRPLLVTMLLAGACDKDAPKDTSTAPPPASPVIDAAPPPAAAANSTSAASSAPPPPKCPAGYTGNPVPAFCIKLPAGYAVKTSRISASRGSIDYDTGSGTDDLMVSYDETPVAAAAKDVESEMKFGNDKLEKKGNLPGGNKWFRGSHQEYARIVTLIKAPPLTLKCSFAYQPKKSPPKDAIDACKSIVVPPT